ncbi:hypothetical protein B0H10DRAFT_2437177 [Mycena sp. CBHHK59/15]|nr:hypothetical protein B0H10DRAFT_2437177 [Mycena sp. CBHHK59/15]
MKKSREEDVQTKKKKEAAENTAVKAVVAIEDEQYRDDAIRADNGNHRVDRCSPPPASPRKIPTREKSPVWKYDSPSSSPSGLGPVARADQTRVFLLTIEKGTAFYGSAALLNEEEEPLDDVPVLGDGSDNFVPAEGDSSEEEDEASEDKELAKPKKVPKPKHADVTASHGTKDAMRTPATSATTGTKHKAVDSKTSKPRKKSKNKVQKKSGLAMPKSGQSSGMEADDDESGVKFGGPSIDDDIDEKLERQEQDSKKKKRGLPTAPIIQIAPTPARPLTKKEQHNNAKKWALAHLPAGTDSLFTNELVPLACELLGTLPPWSSLTADHVQGLVNRVYGTKKDKLIHKVSADGIWCGMGA